jgi:hypothetical protein
MKRIPIRTTILAITLALFMVDQAGSADLQASNPTLRASHRHARRHVITLPPERHVVEVVERAHGNRMIIDGQWFVAMTPACGGWIAGDRVVFKRGIPVDACPDTVVRNMSRHQTCDMRCQGPVYNW